LCYVSLFGGRFVPASFDVVALPVCSCVFLFNCGSFLLLSVAQAPTMFVVGASYLSLLQSVAARCGLPYASVVFDTGLWCGD
jgi:hypothetical protein